MVTRESEISLGGIAPGRTHVLAPVLRKAGFKFVREWVPPITIILLLIAFWQFASSTGLVKKFVLPPPGTVASAFFNNWSVILKHSRPTFIEAMLGFGIGNTVAISLAILFVHSSLAERGLFPVALSYRSIPIVAIIPVLVLAMGNGMSAKIFIASTASFFITLVNMMRGLRAVDGEAAELMHSVSANWWQILWKVRWPASTPFLFSALKLAAAGAFTGAITAEFIGSRQGIGYLILLSSYQYKIPSMWAAIFAASIMALSAFFVVSLLERHFTRWARGGALPD